MEKNANEISMLRYRIKRYQAMGTNHVPDSKRQIAKTACTASRRNHVKPHF